MVAILSALLSPLNMTLSGNDHLEIYTTNMEYGFRELPPRSERIRHCLCRVAPFLGNLSIVPKSGIASCAQKTPGSCKQPGS